MLRRLPFLFLILILATFAIGSAMSRAVEEQSIRGAELRAALEPTTEFVEPLDVDPLPVTEFDPIGALKAHGRYFPSDDQLKTIGRLADGIYKVRTVKGSVPMWYCGEPYEGDAARELSMTIAWHVVRSAWEASDDRFELSPWLWAGLISTESGFDLCTLGLNPRRAAYRLGVLKPRKRTISHTREEVIRAINDPKLSSLFPRFDLGMGQTLDSHYRAYLRFENKEGKSEDLIEWSGFYWQATYLHGLAVRHQTKRPWAFWPGYRAAWKDAKVTRYARALGATPEEVGTPIDAPQRARQRRKSRD